jgi:hypothetical protein
MVDNDDQNPRSQTAPAPAPLSGETRLRCEKCRASLFRVVRAKDGTVRVRCWKKDCGFTFALADLNGVNVELQ